MSEPAARYKRALEIAAQTFDQTVAFTFEDLKTKSVDAEEAQYELETAIAAYDILEDKARAKLRGS